MDSNDKILRISDIIGKVCLTDLDLREFRRALREMKRADKPEGMVIIKFKLSATLLHDMTDAYLKAKKK